MPVLRVIKRAWPHAQVYWWIEAAFAPLLEGDPDLDGLFIFRRKGWQTVAWWREVWQTVAAVRSHRFDYVLDLQGLSRSAFFAWLANGAVAAGLDNEREGRREAAQIFYDVLARPSPRGTPAADRYLGMLEILGLPIDWNFQWLPQRKPVAARVQESAASLAAPSESAARQRWVMLLPGARWMNKRWPAESFAQTAALLRAQDPDLRFAVLGVAGDKPLAELICRANPDHCVDLTGKTSLPEMIEWLRLADLVISNDTGPLHVAAALERPIIAIYGPSDPDYTGPHGQRDAVLQCADLPCVPCMSQTCDYADPLACMKAITPELVSTRALSLLTRPRPSSPAKFDSSLASCS